MNSKNKLIQKLVKVGKKHKILTYPILALVAIISAISYLYRWSRGSGRRVVATILVLALVLSQSYFMTSSANDSAFVYEEEEEQVNLVDVEEEEEESLISSEEAEEEPAGNDTEATTAYDIEDAEDLRPEEEPSSEAVADVDDETDASTSEPNDDSGEDEEVVTKDDKEDTESGKGSVTAMDMPSGAETVMVLPAGTSENDTKKALPSKIVCTIKMVSGTIYSEELDVTWVSDSFVNTSSSTVFFTPRLVDEDDYVSVTEDYTNVKVTVEYFTKYTVKFEPDGGSVDYSSSGFIFDEVNQTYYGFVSKTYQLPNVTRTKLAGGEFTFVDWTLDGASQGAAGADFMTPTAVGELTFVANWKEAEVSYKDEFHETEYRYPDKGTTYNTEVTPATVQGYTFKGWKKVGLADLIPVGNVVANEIDDVELTAVWEKRKYTLVYNPNFGSGSGVGATESKDHTFATPGDTLDQNNFRRFGYRFVGWAFSDSATEADFADMAAIADDTFASYFTSEDVPVINLYAVWEKVSITYDDMTVSKSIGTTYGEAISESYGLVNGADSSENFSATITGAKIGDTDCTISEYIKDFGITASGATMSVVGTPIKLWDGNMTVSVDVSDVAAGTNDVLTVVLTTQKKTLTISDVTLAAKVYDGTADVDKSKLTITLDGVYLSDDVAVNMEDLTVHYDSKDAGNNTKSLVMSNIALTGAAAGNYKIASTHTENEAATIAKKPLNVKLDGKIYKFAGEKAADPSSQDFVLDYDTDKYTSDELAAVQSLVTRDGGLDAIMQITYTVPEVNEQKEYDIDVIIRSDNYEVACAASCKLEVTQDAAVLDETFTVESQYNEETEWYTDVVTIAPKVLRDPDYYNQILIVGTQEWQSNSIVLDDDSEYNGKEIQVVVRNGRTGAYTSDSEKMVFNIDTKAPTYLGAEFTAAGTGSVFNQIGNFFKYGNFFQETVTATLSFEDLRSGCKEIFYKFSGEEKWTQKELTDDSISISIPLGTNNEIIFYVTDVAGNQTEEIKLVGTADGSQWVVEKNNPVLGGYHVENISGDRISNLTSGNWYNQPVQLVADIIESESGVQYADWYINGKTDRVTLDEYVKSGADTTVPVKKQFLESGKYKVSIDVTDNANNTMGITELTELRIDLDAPVITIDENSYKDEWAQSVDVKFTVKDTVSGIYKVSAVTPSGTSYEIRPDADGNYTLTVNEKGKYTIYARDEAGNESSKEISLEQISNEKPKNAGVTWSPENPDGTENWYKTKPVATITPATTEGAAPVTTYYKLWTGDKEPDTAVAVKDVTKVEITEDGIWNLRVWAQTAAGVQSELNYLHTVMVDTTAPDAMITSVLPESDKQTVTFMVSDKLSGINPDKLVIMNGGTVVASTVTATADGAGYQGTFTVASAGTYEVHAYDKAGNVSTVAKYSPMTMKVNAIKNITENSAMISNSVIRGTYAISTVKYEYRKASDSKYKEITPLLQKDELGNVTASYSFQNLKPNTKYYYRMTATSAIGEALTYTGSFKTAGADGINITGVVVDADNPNAIITVSLLEGSTVLETTEIKSGNSFVFNKVADGNYNIVATNGITSKNISVNLVDGKVVDPAGDILITLRSGQTTSVVLNGTKTPNISVSGLEDIFNYDTVNFTEADKKFIAEGGNVEFRLNVTYKSSGAVPQKALAAVYSIMDKNEKVNMFLDLTLSKIRTYASGAVESRTQISELAGGVTIRVVLPLPSKVAKASAKSIIRVHNDAASKLADLDASKTSYTLESGQFSTYALVYSTSKKDKDEEEDKTTEEDSTKDDDKKDDDKKDGGSIKDYDYDSSPKTGDTSPIAALGGLMMISLAGIVLLRRKWNP